jgi:hypothetical protein
VLFVGMFFVLKYHVIDVVDKVDDQTNSYNFLHHYIVDDEDCGKQQAGYDIQYRPEIIGALFNV